MRGAIPPLPNTSSWRGAYLTTGTTLHFILTLTSVEVSKKSVMTFARIGWTVKKEMKAGHQHLTLVCSSCRLFPFVLVM
jgi:hypothetical protein